MKKLFAFALLFLGAVLHAESAETHSPRKIDTLTVKGAVLQGRVTGLTAEALSFSPVYGQGQIRIPYENIEQLSTEHLYHIFYDGKESEGKIVAIHDGRWLVVEDGQSRALISVDDIERFVLSVKDDPSLTNKVHNLVPFWSGNFDIMLEVQEGGSSKGEFDIAGRFEYERTHHRLVILGSREVDRTKQPDANWTTSKDEYYMSIEENYFLTRKREELFFVYSGFERDAIRQIQSRIYPAVGAGYKRTFSRNISLYMQLGIGGVFDRYTTYGQENYPAIYTATELRYKMIYGMLLRARAMYMPSVLHERSAWLFRFNASLAIPLTELFAFKLTLEDIDDNNPFPDIGNNKVTTNFALSFTF